MKISTKTTCTSSICSQLYPLFHIHVFGPYNRMQRIVLLLMPFFIPRFTLLPLIKLSTASITSLPITTLLHLCILMHVLLLAKNCPQVFNFSHFVFPPTISYSAVLSALTWQDSAKWSVPLPSQILYSHEHLL